MCSCTSWSRHPHQPFVPDLHPTLLAVRLLKPRQRERRDPVWIRPHALDQLRRIPVRAANRSAVDAMKQWPRSIPWALNLFVGDTGRELGRKVGFERALELAAVDRRRAPDVRPRGQGNSHGPRGGCRQSTMNGNGCRHACAASRSGSGSNWTGAGARGPGPAAAAAPRARAREVCHAVLAPCGTGGRAGRGGRCRARRPPAASTAPAAA
jgi:hypothetical protein